MCAKNTANLFQFIKAKGDGNQVTELNSVQLLNICWQSIDIELLASWLSLNYKRKTLQWEAACLWQKPYRLGNIKQDWTKHNY